LRACCHRLPSCPCPGSVVRPSRQVIEGAGCPGLDRCPSVRLCLMHDLLFFYTSNHLISPYKYNM
jgi:hypothetical protein